MVKLSSFVTNKIKKKFQKEKLMKLVVAIALSLFTVVGFAETEAKKAKPAPVATTTKLDVTGSLKWTGYGVGKSHAGDITVKGGQVEFKGEKLVGGTITLDMATLKTGDSPRLEGHLKNADFFDVEKFKEGTFKITKVETIQGAKANEPTHKITGDLTIKGKTNTETFTATVAKKDKEYMATAKAQIADRTKYDIVYNSVKFKTASALGDKLIKDEIDVELNLTAKAPAADAAPVKK
jgi:polyisoprenoid-binding protein YceI